MVGHAYRTEILGFLSQNISIEHLGCICTAILVKIHRLISTVDGQIQGINCILNDVPEDYSINFVNPKRIAYYSGLAVLKNCHISRLNAEFMENANFETADVCGNTINADKFMVCPEDGSFTGWKRVVTAKEEPLIVKLEIPANAQRSSANGRNCRASEAKVIAIYDMNTGKAYPKNRYAYSIYRPGFKYKVGETVACEKEFDTNRWNECASGIHFFMTRRDAENY